ncbi:SIMPL domain-containing protein [Methylobacterium bullatum]|uniref:26 kDa periplasmic immunogenic protein n=1 Tax=Methylobacterium bullatum TaxID=570505 RepID=A0AAV4ZE28_9HYPH|nr:SIMPL domain-containing protein [Methylobacterium bullatum]MBD8904257.1 SIMPL domain-containing protein [Methylobacterium bullatum]GJD42121.1 26 kDa periplasmic immunogenic protein [Methylobacterium bullatum]
MRRLLHRAAAASLALALAIPALADDDKAKHESRIVVTGRARAETPPDFASVEIGIEAKGATPAAALDGASNVVRALIALSAGFGVGESDIGTTTVTLTQGTREVRQPDGSITEKPDGYRAANSLRVRLADMGKLGELMRKALDAGANRIEGVAFGLKDPNAAEATVQVAAMKDAMAQAGRLAETAGVKLGPPLSIQTTPQGGGMPMAMAAAPMRSKRSGVPVPLAAGTIETSAEVSASFAILP